MSRTVFYAGSFDPVTFGHLDLIARAARLFGRVVVGVGVHHGKKPLYSDDERVALLRLEIAALPAARGIEVVTFDTLVVDAARAHGASAVLRGIRDATDFDYEMQMSGMNAALAPDLDTIFLPASSAYRHIAATFVRQIAQMGGDVTAFVPPAVAKRLYDKFNSPAAP
ncbi:MULTISPECIES: pantetheine-phosphate adenylyltransferase [Rhodomicrobium]|uniref:pantetheine-phosphate adenylyltransferase n=1 Tax=Rhodomicrobium TaxID=1068 RepID=UPI000B4AFB94|nr:MULTISPECIES: pantetheine-phosphate adenylyltransferase [Rhodomicrobium]